MTLLGIDTSGKTASCAIVRDGIVVGQNTIYTSLTHSQVILPHVERLLADIGITIGDIDIIACANGPGSYTGLRIGAALVKGLCFGGKKCLGVSTLEALAANCMCARAAIFSVMSARPGMVYFGAYASDGNGLTELISDRITEIKALSAYAQGINGDIILTGDGAELVKEALFSDDTRIRISPMSQRLQLAAGVCQAALMHLDRSASAKELAVQYLQVTKAEKELTEKNSSKEEKLDV